MTSKRNYYDILQISIKAEQEIIEVAYKRLALKYHPDKNNSLNATEFMQELNEAYSVLHDPKKRAEYDRTLNLSNTLNPSQDDAYETKWRADEEKRKRDETARNYQTHQQDKETFKRNGEGEQQPRKKAEKILTQKIFLKESERKLILGILGSFSLILVIAVGVFGVYTTNISRPMITPTLLPSPTVPLLNAYINMSVDLGKNNHPLIIGKTNLPDNTIILVTIKNEQLYYSAQDKTSVKKGAFSAGPFSSSGDPLSSGNYSVEALMPLPQVQPESVRKVIGENGEGLVGSQVIHDEGVLVVAKTEFEIVAPTPVPTPTPIIIMLQGGDIGRQWEGLGRRIGLVSVYRTNMIDGEKPYGESGGFTQFLIVKLRLGRIDPGYEDYDLSDFWMWAYTNSGDVEYKAEIHNLKTTRVDYGQDVDETIAFEIMPNSHNFILCFQQGIGYNINTGKWLIDCGDYAYQFKFGD